MDDTLQWYLDENEKIMRAIDDAIKNGEEDRLACLCRQHRQLMRGYWRYVYKDIPLEELQAECQTRRRERLALREKHCKK